MPADDVSYIRSTNLDNYTMQLCILAGEGYDTITNLKNMDTKEFLDVLEFHQIRKAIEAHEMRKSHG